MSARFVPLNEEGASRPIPLSRPILLVGRHRDCDVRIDLPQISRRHCCIAMAYNRLLIRDLGSRNGVRVNGRLVEEVQLFPGDEIAIGQLLYRLESPTPEPGPTPTAPPSRPADEPKPLSLPVLPPNPGDLGPNSLGNLFADL